MDSVDRGGRRIGLGRCKKDGDGAWWTDRPPLMQIFFMGWAGGGGGGECGKDGVARKEIKVFRRMGAGW